MARRWAPPQPRSSPRSSRPPQPRTGHPITSTQAAEVTAVLELHINNINIKREQCKQSGAQVKEVLVTHTYRFSITSCLLSLLAQAQEYNQSELKLQSTQQLAQQMLTHSLMLADSQPSTCVSQLWQS
ncbi:hypothetical protein Q8A67_024302 [Cirrhinus molitorella]|uniref:Uncharacterized protein n=1 Tax=Cirrhinus molitorella TaxID=172907 RepID=A0AA88P1R2_9TELE|nr:hypothetical protein Q8A67_024302 [Cirrhinus molitorella]